MAEMLEAALHYLYRYRIPVIPIEPRGKKPLVSWNKYQKDMPTDKLVRNWWSKWPDANIGIVTGEVSNRSVIDVDSEEGGRVLVRYIPEGWVTPMVMTPRGGIHYYCRYAKGVGNNAGGIRGVDFRGDGGYVVAPPSIGTNGKPYEWVTNRGLGDIACAEVPAGYLERIATWQCKNMHSGHSDNNDLNKGAASADGAVSFRQGRRDEDVFHTALCLAKGGMKEDDIRKVAVMIAKNCDPPFPEKEALTKVESAVKRVNAKDRNITQEVREWILASPGIFSSSDIHKELDFASSSLKHAVTNCLGRLCQEGLIARQGNRRGMYRRVEQEAEHIDWRKAPTAEYPLRLPFDLERMVKIFPKNIILIAGDPNSGKTALMLNIVKDNMKDLPVWYFSSEMGGVEMRERIAMFDDPPPDAWTFKAVERSHGFADVIRPDALNIIDYLEVHKDFWEVGGWIREIHDRLKKGVAVIALQKKRNVELGRGAEMSLEKPRLYLSVSAKPPVGNTLSIVKAKNFRDKTANPNGKKLDFKIVNGCRLIASGERKHP